MNDRDDAALVRRFLERVEGRTHARAAEAVGLSATTVRRWRAGHRPRWLRKSTRKKLRTFLARAREVVVAIPAEPAWRGGDSDGWAAWLRAEKAREHVAAGLPAGEPGGAAAGGESTGAGADPGPETDVLVSADAVRRYLGSLGAPGADAARKLDALDGLRQAITSGVPVPDWWYSLREAVEEGGDIAP